MGVMFYIVNLRKEGGGKMAALQGYFFNEEDYERKRREVTEGQPQSCYNGYINDIAAVVYHKNRSFYNRDIHFGALIECYAQSGYPGLKSHKVKARVSSHYEYSFRKPPVDEDIIINKITVERDVFSSWLMENAHRILVGDLLPDVHER